MIDKQADPIDLFCTIDWLTRSGATVSLETDPDRLSMQAVIRIPLDKLTALRPDAK